MHTQTHTHTHIHIQAALLNDFAAYVRDQGVVALQQDAMTAAVRKVFNRVCVMFAVGCSRILDSKVLPPVLRNAFTRAMKLKIRKLVTSGPISDVAVAMNKEQAAMLTAVGFERQVQFLDHCILKLLACYKVHIRLNPRHN